MDLIIGLIAIVAVSYYIVKGYSATGVLMTVGILLLLASVIMGKEIMPAGKSTGTLYLDVIEYVKYLLMHRGGGLGMLIMVLCGFAAYMTHLGANDIVVKIASRPLKYINSPYLLMVVAYFLACLMSFAVTSATGLGVLLMATLFPIMVNVGISRGAAASICASPAAIILSPTSGDVVLAAEVSKMPLIEFAFSFTLPISIIAILCIAATHFFWQRYLDRKEGFVPEQLEVSEIETKVPTFYAILPFTPIIGVLIFNGNIAPKLHIVTIIILCLVIVAILDFIRTFNAKVVYENLEVMYKGMADAFSGVVMLLVAAGVFAQGLSTVGFIKTLITSVQSMGSGGFLMMITLALITALAAIATGSGNAPFYAFVELIPRLAVQMGINPAYLTIPMLQASNIGRSLSPVSGVVVAVSGMAKLSPFEVVKRISVPMIVGLIVVIAGTELLVAA
ncbi:MULTISPECIES: anaerobic C4-dicarboxylate transporter DcuC [Pasteurellaceae]|uniref:Anaerobic C4-dicarboxylate transporter DcuC n=1 Tax=Pasteurella atlantica TaxID=2827233 RepID=A0AAW8CQZ0_9PAST|nr:anaerobic C4-dicarboxylate transporter DcuC [Pasteurella atlantica]MBR0573918.1 anaerobic C4-dicarboxylate transporter DcuC [Pasteurella atlantica]MDP8039847.1 anaerobic C4-dicarboxylate transporter DcuC [Pasteurella atlantica]MDP8041993.1 anaerobic C4-dicarboxylate transporter DcuC [Pasteurella atlantica]MDP8046192.1 anaerobic C4-dicarboxylate transporter DcuC [Pasteurella atlantica]MDP8062036.1 anaerobic C4-dicarboxylate transporter DcuC [Pasteurella atlantica]